MHVLVSIGILLTLWCLVIGLAMMRTPPISIGTILTGFFVALIATSVSILAIREIRS